MPLNELSNSKNSLNDSCNPMKIRNRLSSFFTSVSNNSYILFSLYFIRGKRFVTGTFLYIYTIHKGRKTENGKYVCTSVTSRVHTVG